MKVRAKRLNGRLQYWVHAGSIAWKQVPSEWGDFLKGTILTALLVITAFNVLVLFNRVEVQVSTAPALPQTQLVAPAEVMPAPRFDEPLNFESAYESATHIGDVPGYTTAPRSESIDVNALSPESGQAMSGVLYR